MTRLPAWRALDAPPRLGISSCLLGNSVRYDGRHKLDTWLVERLGPHVAWVPVCPEIELGMGTPRPPIRLVRAGDAIELREVESRRDHTAAMQAYATRRVAELEQLHLCGYVLKRGSPSCGLLDVDVCNADGTDARPEERGIFARALTQSLALIPVEEEGRLRDAALRESFVERVFTLQRLRALFTKDWTLGELVDFHSAYKLVVLAHETTAYQSLGRLVARGAQLEREALRERYSSELLSALARPTTPGRHANVLQHAAGYFRKRLDSMERAELTQRIEAYRLGHAPLRAPLTLLRELVHTHGVEYLAGQLYLEPSASERELLERA